MTLKILAILALILEFLHLPWLGDKIESRLQNQMFSKTKADFIEEKEDVENELPPLPIKISEKPVPYFQAEGVVVMDVATSKILFEKNADQLFSIASLTKIMTAVVALENYQLEEVITVPKEATNVLPGALIYLREGEQMAVLNLLYGLLVSSGNDAAFALASKMGEVEFVKEMNQKAQMLGLFHTHFKEPSGLSDENKSTPFELAFLTAYALRNPVLTKILKTNEIVISSVDGKISHPLRNTNQLLREYQGTLGGKTGYTEGAGHSLITVVKRNGGEVISVVLKSPVNQFEESRKILNWLFEIYQW